MILDLYGQTHLQTLQELMEIAKRHNCHISITIRADHSLDEDATSNVLLFLVDHGLMTESTSEGLTEGICYDIENPRLLHDIATFELVEHLESGWEYNRLVYGQYDARLTICKDVFHKGRSQEVEEWIEDNSFCEIYDSHYWGDFSGSYSEVHGFKGTDTKVNIYREGMAMKNFADLVCDYLHEPRIERTY